MLRRLECLKTFKDFLKTEDFFPEKIFSKFFQNFFFETFFSKFYRTIEFRSIQEKCLQGSRPPVFEVIVSNIKFKDLIVVSFRK